MLIIAVEPGEVIRLRYQDKDLGELRIIRVSRGGKVRLACDLVDALRVERPSRHQDKEVPNEQQEPRQHRRAS